MNNDTKNKSSKNVIRVISIILAVIFWFLITNRENPITTVRYDVPIQIVNESIIKDRKLHVVEDYIKTVEISVRGRRNSLSHVSASDFHLSVDFADYAVQGEHSIKLDKPVYTGGEVINYEIFGKNTLDLILESTGEKMLEIECITEGTPDSGYSVSSIDMVPERIPLENLSSLVNEAVSARVTVNIDRLNSDKTYKETVKIYDRNGNELDILPQNVMVDVKVTIRKEVELVLNYTGEPAYDFYIDENDITWEPVKGYVVGYKEVMESYDVIYTEPLNIAGRNESFTGQVSFKLPEGLRLVGGNYANVHVGIKPFEYKTIEFSKDDIYVNWIYIDSSLDWTMITDKVTMVIKGKSEDVANLVATDFSPHITLPVRDGEYELPLQVTMPDNVTLVNFGYVKLNIVMKKRITANTENINILNKSDEEYDYVITDERASITLNGPSDILEGITDDELNLYVDTAGLTTGVHRFPVRLNNAGMTEVTLKSTSNVSVKITPKMNQQETSAQADG